LSTLGSAPAAQTALSVLFPPNQPLFSAVLVVSEALADPSLARTVSAPEPGTVVSDGPYAESKEYLAGFYLVECESLDRAAGYAARLPHGPQYRIEVRPVMNLKALLEQA